MGSIALRPMRVDDVALLEWWDRDPAVAAFGGGADWYDWRVELARDVGWRDLLIAEEDGRPVGFMQLLDCAADESGYWAGSEPGVWAFDIWIGDPADRGRGLGEQMMRRALDRAFGFHAATTVVLDPLVTNVDAIRFYQRLGFRLVAERRFGDDLCAVHRLDRPPVGDHRACS